MSKRYKNKRRLKELHKTFIEELVEKQYLNKLTANDIKNKLEEKFDDFKEIRKSTIARRLKKILDAPTRRWRKSYILL